MGWDKEHSDFTICCRWVLLNFSWRTTPRWMHASMHTLFSVHKGKVEGDAKVAIWLTSFFFAIFPFLGIAIGFVAIS